MSEKYPRSVRITRPLEIREVMQRGKRVHTSDLDVYALASPVGILRSGVITPLYGRTAVRRNQLKRRLREVIRRDLTSETGSLDIIVRVRPGAYDRTFGELKTQMARIRTLLEGKISRTE